jgi:hypothetical protein
MRGFSAGCRLFFIGVKTALTLVFAHQLSLGEDMPLHGFEQLILGNPAVQIEPGVQRV